METRSSAPDMRRPDTMLRVADHRASCQHVLERMKICQHVYWSTASENVRSELDVLDV
jgi:hypothetical protein